MLRMEGNFSVLKFSTIDLEKKLAELGMELHRLRMEGTLPPPELFTSDLEDELEQLRRLIWILEDRKREKVHTLRKELEKVKMEALENAMYPTIRSGLAKFDVSLPEELQSYVSYLLNESAKLVLRKQVPQSPRALEELREAMDQDELKTFLAIHIREVAWQVVLLFTDELPRVELPWECHEDEDEDEEVFSEVIYSSKSGILNAWPTEYDPALVTLCNAITNRDWKVARLILCWSQISDAGLKNLSAALTQSELYSLTLYGIDLQSQGLEHLCTALTSVNCRLTNLNVGCNRLADVGIMHLCNALTSVNCTLTSLNVSENRLGDVGIMHLCNALTSVNCTLTSLNVSKNGLGDVGIMHLCNALASVNCRLTGLLVSYNELGENGLKYLCDALTSSNCTLTKLKVRSNGLGDAGIKELSEVLTNGFCTLTSLDISYNEFGDEGIKHLCKALTDTKCKLQSLNLQGNRYGTDGKKYLFQMLTGTDWEVKGALRLFRSTKK
nr:ribonuclease inhibitor-like isoform X2 [Pocillopora verrucosa]